MERRETQRLGDALTEFLREQGLEKGFLEQRVISLWPQVVGPMASKYTCDLNINDGLLFVRCRSAVLRHELFNCRPQLVAKLNEAVGAQIVKDIRLF